MNLEEKISQAVQAGIQASEINDFIGVKPIINTLFDADREAALLADLAPDPEHSDMFLDLNKQEIFAYWKLSDESHFTKIAGITWNSNLNPQMFYALILAP